MGTTLGEGRGGAWNRNVAEDAEAGMMEGGLSWPRKTSLPPFAVTEGLGGGESRILSGADKFGTTSLSTSLTPRCRCHLAAQ